MKKEETKANPAPGPMYASAGTALDYLLRNFKEGLLFFYFSSIDQGSHMLWRHIDPNHPGYAHDKDLMQGIRILYQQIDEVIGDTMDSLDGDDTLIVMSDHGFSPFYWGVNLNSWLLEKGYVHLKNPSQKGRYSFFLNVDWSRTRAYALGLNGLYVNLRGREKHGIVSPGAEERRLVDQLEIDLLAMKDPRSGQNPVSLVIQPRRDFDESNLESAPDIVVGYNWGYRSSWKSPLGGFPKPIFEENEDPWSGDHGIDFRLVPGVLMTNQKVTLRQPALHDLTVAVLDEYGVRKAAEMIGRDCLAPRDGPDR